MSRPALVLSQDSDEAAVLRDDVRRYAEQVQVGAGATLLLNQSIGTTETAIAHGLRSGAPSAWLATPQADARVWQTQPSDASFLYLAASVAVTCNLLVV